MSNIEEKKKKKKKKKLASFFLREKREREREREREAQARRERGMAATAGKENAAAAAVEWKPGDLALHRMGNYPAWPVRILSWGLKDDTDPAQPLLPITFWDMKSSSKENKVLFVYMGRSIDFGDEYRNSKNLLKWDQWKDDLKVYWEKEGKEVDFLKSGEGKQGHYFKTLKANDTDYVRAVEEALRYDEEKGDKDWFFDEYGKEKYEYSKEKHDNFCLDIDYHLEQKKNEMDDLQSAKSKLQKLAQKNKKKESASNLDDFMDEDLEYTASGRPVKRLRGAMGVIEDDEYSVGDEDEDDYDFQQRKREKKLKTAKRANVNKISTPNKLSKDRESVRRPEKKMTMKKWKQNIEPWKGIVPGSDKKKSCEYFKKLLEAAGDEMLAPNYTELIGIWKKIEKLEERAKEIAETIRDVSTDVNWFTSKVLESQSEFSTDVLLKTQLPRAMGTFTASNKAFLKSIPNVTQKMGKNGSEVPKQVVDMNNNLRKLKQGWKERSKSGVTGSKAQVTLSPREGDKGRERVAESFSMLFGKKDFDMMIGRNIEEDIFNRHGLEGKTAYEKDVLNVYQKLGEEGKDSYLSKLGQGKLAIKDFLSNVL